MIKYLRHTNIDKKKWDECIDQSSDGYVYVLSWWLDIVCPGWEALIEDDYVAVMPLPVKKKWGMTYIVQPYFCQQLGIFSKNSLTEFRMQEFITKASDVYSYLFITLNSSNANLYAKDTSARYGHILKLDKTYEVLFQNYSESHKKNLRRAARYNVSVRNDCRPADLLKILGKHKSALWNNESLEKAGKITEEALKKGMAKIYAAYVNNNIIGGAFFVFYKKRIHYMFSATTYESETTKAMFLLTDRLINDYASTEYILDFMGSMIPGVAYFNEGFGAERINFSQIQINNLPFFLKLLRKCNRG